MIKKLRNHPYAPIWSKRREKKLYILKLWAEETVSRYGE
jgi:hypothetical protein